MIWLLRKDIESLSAASKLKRDEHLRTERIALQRTQAINEWFQAAQEAKAANARRDDRGFGQAARRAFTRATRALMLEVRT